MKFHLVVGSKGEVGSALVTLLKEKFQVEGIDKDDYTVSRFDYVHITIPYTKDFIKIVHKYRAVNLKLSTGVLIIHSTVPVGVSQLLKAVHSPIRGQHPHLVKGIKTFVKYFGGEQAEEAAKPFRELGIECIVVKDSRSTEALKLWDTLQYGLFILINKSIYQYCEELGLNPYFIYDHANRTYNEGYQKLDKSGVTRPILKYMPGPIGGHCIMENARMISDSLADLLLERNSWYNKE